jgi:hypothetical protein
VFACESRLIQSKVTTVVAANERLGSNELLVGQLGKGIIEIAPRRGTEISRPLPTEIIRDWAPDYIEGCSALGNDVFDEVAGSIERKA